MLFTPAALPCVNPHIWETRHWNHLCVSTSQEHGHSKSSNTLHIYQKIPVIWWSFIVWCQELWGSSDASLSKVILSNGRIFNSPRAAEGKDSTLENLLNWFFFLNFCPILSNPSNFWERNSVICPKCRVTDHLKYLRNLILFSAHGEKRYSCD